jgi:hypothetical protein
MLKTPRPLLLVATCISLTVAATQAEDLSEDLPRNLPAEMGAVLWLKADEKLELYARGNGTVVSSWQSKVGILTANQSSSESARIEGNQTIGGNKAAIFFPQGNATGGYGYFEIESNFNLKNSTVFVSLKYEGGSEYPRVLSFLENGEDSDWESNSALALNHYNGTNQFRLESNKITATSPTYATGNWTILSYRIDGNGNMTVSLNGTAGNQTSNLNMAAKNTAGKIHIARPNRQIDGEKLYNAHIYEILIFNQYLNDDQYAAIQNYMQDSMEAVSVQVQNISLPTASLINLGSQTSRPLSTSILTGGNASSNGTAVAGKFKWSDGSMAVTQSGNYSAIFVPDSAKYYSSEEVNVRVVVKPELNRSTGSLTGFRNPGVRKVSLLQSRGIRSLLS